MEILATMPNAQPVSPATLYRLQSLDDVTITTDTWDYDKIYGCLCDSTWSVGLGYGETQEAEWFGPDCSLRHCPSGDNPSTEAIETNCSAVTPSGLTVTSTNSTIVGEYGNLCQVDCSNQGICDFDTGVCKCFRGHFGNTCGINAALYNPDAFTSYSTALDGEAVETEPLDAFYGDT
jgi:hypothetical protein